MLRLDTNLLWTLINLVVLYILLRKFLFKPVRNILAKRKAEIDQSYGEAAKAQKEADALKAQYTAAMQDLEAQKAAGIEEAKQQAGKEYDQLIAAAHTDSDKILSDARKQADATVHAAKGRAADEIAAMAKDVFSQAAAKGGDTQLYEDFLDQAEQTGTGKADAD